MFLPRNHLLQMSPSLGGGGGGGVGGRAVVALEREIIKSPANSAASSPSSTLSESSNTSGALSIATRKPRTPRKRPNQTYNEAAALLSTAYPNLFNSPKYPSAAVSDMSFFFPDVNDTSFIPEKPVTPRRMQVTALSSPTAGECNSHSQQPEEVNGDEFDFDAESILDEEVDERGIDSIMGNLTVESAAVADDGRSTCYGYPMGLGLGLGFGIRALRRDFQEANWWRFPTVEMVELSPRLVSPPPPPMTAEEKKSKKKSATKKMKKTKAVVDVIEAESATKECEGVLSLKLNYDVVLKAWSDKGSPFSEDGQGVENDDVAARLAQIELFPEGESGGVREACVLRYKEKRRTRLFSKKIRYQVRKVNADQRPRMKGRFVRRPNSKHEMNID